jgi:hypothetical protein
MHSLRDQDLLGSDVVLARKIRLPRTYEHKLEVMSTSSAGDLPVAEQKLESVLDEPVLSGVLHIYVAFDWGEEVHLEQARGLVSAEVHNLPRRRRTPSSIGYRPPPLRFALPPVTLELPELGSLQAPAEAILFDFGAISTAMHLPFSLPQAALIHLASGLAEPSGLVRAARCSLEPMYARLLPAIQSPEWKDGLSEEYFVFQLSPEASAPPPSELTSAKASWLAALVRLETLPLSQEEIAEALRLYLRYTPQDLFLPDWAAAVLIDRDCDETLQTIEFANLQLLEFRHIDGRLDDVLTVAYGLLHATTVSRLPLWRSHARTLRLLGELKVEAYGLFERTGNVLKLVGDQYLARVYRLLAGRFHLEQWEQGIQRKLEVAEGVYQVVSDQTDTYRAEFLEITVVVLILLEVVLALFRR